jgi:hypothetical protein
MRHRINEIAQRFRDKGATAPERAMTAQDLGLPPRFEQAMKRRLGQTGVFVEVNGKYYLDEARLRQMQERGPGQFGGSRQNFRGSMFGMRITRMIVGVLAILLVLINIFERSTIIWLVILALVIVWIGLSIFQIYFMASARRNWVRSSPPNY